MSSKLLTLVVLADCAGLLPCSEEPISDPALPALHYLQRRRPHLHTSVSLLAGLPYSRPVVAIGRSGVADALLPADHDRSIACDWPGWTRPLNLEVARKGD
jgi:hypothetical protein